jgi:uncharacterized membrane protein YdjX (TVP38/TMEM64 family)/rhodanese-related sulfurtransferase
MTGWRALPRLSLGVAIAGAAIWLAINRDSLDPAFIETTIRNLGVWGPVGHIAIFAVATVVFLPGAIFGLAGGALFGPLWGMVLNLAGATLGASASFLIARYVAAEWFRRKAGGRLERLMAGVDAEGWRFVAFTRLVPLFPFNFLNYALGLTRIPLTHYALASIVCMAPGTLAYSWLGHAGREAAAGDASAIRYGLVALGLLAAIAFLPRLVRRLRRHRSPHWMEVDELANRLREPDRLAVIDVREADEFDGPLGHIAEASNLPLGELPRRLMEISALKDRPVVLICRTDKRSASAAAVLRDAGFRNVRVLRGGMEQWNRNGLLLEGVGAPLGRTDNDRRT